MRDSINHKNQNREQSYKIEQSIQDKLLIQVQHKIAESINKHGIIPIRFSLAGGGDATIGIYAALSAFLFQSVKLGLSIDFDRIVAISGSTYIGLAWVAALKQAVYSIKSRAMNNKIITPSELEDMLDNFIHKVKDIYILDYFSGIHDLRQAEIMLGALVFDHKRFARDVEEAYGFISYPRFIIPTTYMYKHKRVINSAKRFSYDIGKSVWTAITIPGIVPYRDTKDIYLDAGVQARIVSDVWKYEYSQNKLQNAFRIGLMLTTGENKRKIIQRLFERIDRKVLRAFIHLISRNPMVRKTLHRIVNNKLVDDPGMFDVIIRIRIPKEYSALALTYTEKLILWRYVYNCIKHRYNFILDTLIRYVLPNLHRLRGKKSLKGKLIDIC